MSFYQSATRWFDRTEGVLASLVLVAIAVLLPAEMVARFFDTAVPGALPIVQHLTLWVAFLGAALAAGEGKLLALATATFLPEGGWRRAAEVFAALVAAAVTALLGRAGLELLLVEKEFGDTVALG
ncbi:MAG: TRAP transporter small permease subunit, partial [bacterium]|nr:TRAP transporter small permease subunit [bacterium]